jgi:hypothetical protein
LREEFFVNYENCMTQLTYAFDGVEHLLQAPGPRAALGRRHQQICPLYRSADPAMPLFASAGVVISGDTTPHAKPHPAPLLEAARRLGVLPSAVSTWVMTSETSWQGMLRAWSR